MAVIRCFICQKNFDIDANDHICPHCGAYNLSPSGSSSESDFPQRTEQDAAENSAPIGKTERKNLQQAVPMQQKEQQVFRTDEKKQNAAVLNSVKTEPAPIGFQQSAVSADVFARMQELQKNTRRRYLHFFIVAILAVLLSVAGNFLGNIIKTERVEKEFFTGEMPVYTYDAAQYAQVDKESMIQVADFAIPGEVSEGGESLKDMHYKPFFIPYQKKYIPDRESNYAGRRQQLRCYARLKEGKCVDQEYDSFSMEKIMGYSIDSFRQVYEGGYENGVKLMGFLLPEDTREFTVCIVTEERLDDGIRGFYRSEFPVTVNDEEVLDVW